MSKTSKNDKTKVVKKKDDPILKISLNKKSYLGKIKKTSNGYRVHNAVDICDSDPFNTSAKKWWAAKLGNELVCAEIEGMASVSKEAFTDIEAMQFITWGNRAEYIADNTAFAMAKKYFNETQW